jgi:hypothetical protein
MTKNVMFDRSFNAELTEAAGNGWIVRTPYESVSSVKSVVSTGFLG